jgi:hypothetical protein
MAETNFLPVQLEFSSLQDPGERYTLGDLLGSGVYSEVFEARDQDNGKNKYHYASEVPQCEWSNNLNLPPTVMRAGRAQSV